MAEPAGVVMGMYRSAWTSAAVLTGAAGIYAAVRSWSVGAAVFLFLFVAVTALCISLLATKEGDRPDWGRACRTGLAWGAVVLAASGLDAWLGVPGLAVVAVLVVLSPTVLAKFGELTGVRRREGAGRRRRSRPWFDGSEPTARTTRPAERPVAVVTDPSVLDAAWMRLPARSMDDQTLCRTWRTSYVALQQPLPVPARTQVVARRQEVLDELERRNARGFEAWLASGPRAAGDPTKYITARSEADGRDEG